MLNIVLDFLPKIMLFQISRKVCLAEILFTCSQVEKTIPVMKASLHVLQTYPEAEKEWEKNILSFYKWFYSTKF